MFISCFQGCLFRFLGTDSRSRRARAPWFVRSVDIFSFAVGSSARSYFVRFALLLTLLAFFTIYNFCICAFIRICYNTVDNLLLWCYSLLDN